MRLSITGSPPVEHEGLLRNIAHAESLDLPKAGLGRNKREGRLAVVGGGPSVPHHLARIREASEVWAINGACAFLRNHGIESVFFAVDPHPIVAKWAVGASKALLCNRVDPEVFRVLKGAEIRLYGLEADGDGVKCGSSTATVAFHLGVEQGFTEIDFFGCESSYDDATHAYNDEKREDELVVECGGKRFRTAPDYYAQAQEMAAIIRHFPKHFRHHGGGLLQAMIDHREFDVVWVSQSMARGMTPIYEETTCQSS